VTIVAAPSGGSLEALARARLYLAEATDLTEVVKIRDQAESIRSYLQVQRESLAMQNQAAELKLESELVRGSHPTKGVCIPLVHLLRWLMESEDGQG
jgi:hypothetical protein